jgi:hypothetical protein
MVFGPLSRSLRMENRGGCSGKGAAVSRQEVGANNAAEQAPRMDGWFEWMEGWMGDLVVFRPRLRGNLNQQRVRDDDRQCRRGVEVQRWTKLGDGQVPGRVMDEMLCDGGRGRMQGVGSPKDDWIDRLAPPLSLFVVPVPDSVLSQITRVLLDARYSLLRVRRAAESRSRRRWMQSGRWGSDAWEEGLYLDLTRFRPGSRARCEKRSGLAGALPRPRLVDNQLPLIRRVLVLGP